MRIGKIVKFVLWSVISFSAGIVFGAYFYEKIRRKGHFDAYQNRLFEECRSENLTKGIRLDGYFIRNGYNRIVVYGLGAYYREFLEQVDEANFKEIFLANKNAKSLHIEGHKVYDIDELRSQDFYDVIVITSINHAEEIEQELRSAGIQREIISYKDLVINATMERQV